MVPYPTVAVVLVILVVMDVVESDNLSQNFGNSDMTDGLFFGVGILEQHEHPGVSVTGTHLDVSHVVVVFVGGRVSREVHVAALVVQPHSQVSVSRSVGVSLLIGSKPRAPLRWG